MIPVETQLERAGHRPRSAVPACSVAYMGSILSFLAHAEETEGRMSVILAHAKRGSEPPPHVHHHEDEFLYVLEGKVEIFVEGTDASFVAGPADAVLLPAARAHVLRFLTPELRMLIVVSAKNGWSVGLEGYFRQMADGPAVGMGLPDPATQYRTASAAQLEQAVERGRQAGMSLLSPDEIRTRLPAWSGPRTLPEVGRCA